MRKDFYHSLLQPYWALVSRAAQNDLIGTHTSDLTAAANALAVAAAHFIEANKLAPGSNDEEKLRSMLQDVADSAKHGQLRNGTRTVTLSVSLAYEFDNAGQFRFLKTEVTARNGKYGSFDLLQTLGRYIRALNDRLNLQFPRIEPAIEPKPFGSEAASIITNNTAEVGAVNIRTYKRDAFGVLKLTDPESVLFVVR